MACNVVIVGAGIAGLSAALELARRGCHVRILEARDRLGGRIWTVRSPRSPYPIELGAEFVHGRHPVLWDLARRAGVLLYELSGEHAHSNGGRLTSQEPGQRDRREIFSRMESLRGPDRSFADYLREHFAGPRYEEARLAAAGYVEGFNAADSERVSVEWLAETGRAASQIGGERLFRPVTGYATLVAYLASELEAAGVRVTLRAVVRTVRWSPGRARVEFIRDGSEGAGIDADAVLVAVPLGVLQASPDETGGIRIDPAVPEHDAAIRSLASGEVFRMSLLCTDALCEAPLPAAGGRRSLSRLGFVHSVGECVPTWWTAYPVQAPVLTAWAGGPKAARMGSPPPRKRAATACAALGRITGLGQGAVEAGVVETHHHDWRSDPFARGAYSWVPAGAASAPGRLSEPCAGTLFFAGEATDTTGHTGTVHAALASGLRAAAQVLDRRKA